ncbi:alpha/beta hydrolase [Paenibacillus thalictri]|uniref:Alpha/beta hydrolase n=1 Tax=Paenibacillus thalictri TaxID=2527873 RepID=A0A4Q9DTK6_9BACL|nr:alpha/beta hydrolase [Paenibacillus thalictri]TBL79030.1 alpha/beta hydrolase [Paenibacillus thalictri]
MRQNVKFKNNGLLLAGHLYVPAHFDETKKYPTIVVSHPGGGVKEQTAGLYADKLSELGYVTLAFDASNQGESEGSPRYYEDPYARTEDIRAAVDYLTTLSFVDTDHIGALGICAGGGYTVAAAQTDRRIKALATVSMVDIGSLFSEGMARVVPVEDQIKLLEQVSQQRTAEANGNETFFVTYVPQQLEEGMTGTMAEGHDYYVTARGCHNNAPNRLVFASFGKIATYSAFSHIDKFLTQPFLTIAGSEADTLYFSAEAVEKAASQHKELFIIKGATHVALYDIPENVNVAIEKIDGFFTENLK